VPFTVIATPSSPSDSSNEMTLPDRVTILFCACIGVKLHNAMSIRLTNRIFFIIKYCTTAVMIKENRRMGSKYKEVSATTIAGKRSNVEWH
jgi:hypothetical protein